MSAVNNGTTTSDDSSSDDNTGIVAAIVVGIIIFIVLHIILLIIIVWYIRNRKRGKLRNSESKLMLKFTVNYFYIRTYIPKPVTYNEDGKQVNNKVVDGKKVTDKLVTDEKQTNDGGLTIGKGQHNNYLVSNYFNIVNYPSN